MTGAPDRLAQLFPEWRGHEPLASGFIAAFRSRHPSLAAAWEHDYPRLDRVLAAQDPWRGYGHWGDEAARLSPDADPAWFAGFLLWNIERFDDRFRLLGLEPEFRLHFTDSFHRIFAQVVDDPSFASPSSDSFMKDLGIARGTLIPALARLLYPYAGLSVAHLVANPGLVPFVYLRCGGRRPFLGLHVHQPMARAYFNPAGWAESLRLGAMALHAFPAARGLMGASWFYDPAVVGISPHLRYLVDAPLRNGARLLRIGESSNATRDALQTSQTRRAAHQRGVYRPCSYALLWPRRDIAGTTKGD